MPSSHDNPSSPRRPNSNPPRRKLTPPHERFIDVAPPGSVSPFDALLANPEEPAAEKRPAEPRPATEPRATTSRVPADAPIDDLFEWRHLPPSERQRRAAQQRAERREAQYRSETDSPRGESPRAENLRATAQPGPTVRGEGARGPRYNRDQRIHAEREFSQLAREEPPQTLAPAPRQRRAKTARPPRPRRPRRNYWPAIRRVLSYGLAVGALALSVAAFTAPPFRIRKVQVEGLESISAARVQQLVRPLKGQNMLRVRTGAVTEKLLEFPSVQSVSVSRPLAWPPVLVFNVVERQPTARVGEGSNWWVVDENGVPFRKANFGTGDENLFPVTGPQFIPQPGKAFTPTDWARATELLSDLRADGGPSVWHLRRIQFNAWGDATLRVVVPAGTAAAAATGGAVPATDDGETVITTPVNLTPGAANLAEAASKAAGAPADSTIPAPAQENGGGNSPATEAANQPVAADEMEVRLRLGDWPQKLVRTRRAMAYFARTGRQAASLDWVNFDKPLWTMRGAPDPAAPPVPAAGANGAMPAAILPSADGTPTALSPYSAGGSAPTHV